MPFEISIVLHSVIFADIHTIAVIKANETYQNISIGFKDAIDAINSLVCLPPVLIIDDEIYELEFFFVADYKVHTCI